jgi:hypothetical protein
MMSSSTNGRHGGHDDPIRRLRYDHIPAIIEQTRARSRPGGETGAGATTASWLGRSDSGRRFVTLAVIAVLIVWASLYLVFREWRARYRVRAAYGATQVAPAIDAFADRAPPGVEATRWRDAVERTHAMLVTVTASNLLGLDEMKQLRAEIERAAGRAGARRESAVAELAAVWDDMSERGEFLMRDTRSLTGDRHPRPGILPSYGADRVAPALDPLDEFTPPGVVADRWRDAIRTTRALVSEVTASRLISTMRMMDLRRDIDRAVAHARAHPASAVADLAVVWDSLQRSGESVLLDRKDAIARLVRPEIFPAR